MKIVNKTLPLELVKLVNYLRENCKEVEVDLCNFIPNDNPEYRFRIAVFNKDFSITQMMIEETDRPNTYIFEVYAYSKKVVMYTDINTIWAYARNRSILDF